MPLPKTKKKIIRRVVRKSKLDELADAVAEELGSDAVHRGTMSDLGEPRLWVPSGVPDLDNILDRERRGWPSGRIVEIYGGEATCKTGIAYALIAEVQKMGGDAALFMGEGNYDEWLALQYGIDLEHLIIGDDNTVEGVFGAANRMMRAAPRQLMIAVIDSVAGLMTREELAAIERGDPFGRDRSAQVRALLISQAMRRMGAHVPRTNMILFLVNQVRDNPDAMYDKKAKPPGGKAIKFYSSIRLRLEIISKYKRQRGGKTFVAGFKLKLTSEKNRLARPWSEATILLDFEKGLLPIKKAKARKRR